MSRTPMLRRLGALGQAQREANRLGIDIEEVVGRSREFARTDAGLTRRDLMKRAAMALKDAGFTRVTVYESSDRVGGRTYTRKNDGLWDNGQWSEWAAS